MPQVTVFQKLDPIVTINKLIAGKHKIRFSKGQIVFISIIRVDTLFSNTQFHVLPTNILFLFYV
jgi:hypothetical protein